jgi:hypothetical protein
VKLDETDGLKKSLPDWFKEKLRIAVTVAVSVVDRITSQGFMLYIEQLRYQGK